MKNHDDAFVHALPNFFKKILVVGPYWWFNKINDIELCKKYLVSSLLKLLSDVAHLSSVHLTIGMIPVIPVIPVIQRHQTR